MDCSPSAAAPATHPPGHALAASYGHAFALTATALTAVAALTLALPTHRDTPTPTTPPNSQKAQDD